MTKIEARIDAIYARIPKLNCQRKCQSSCGPILCSSAEFERMKAVSLVPLNAVWPSLDCPALQGGSCSVYAVRPLICRLWGVVREMACPHGCEPERWLTDTEASALLRDMRKVGGETDGPAMGMLP